MNLKITLLMLVMSLGLQSCSSRSIKSVESKESGAIVGNLKIPGGYRYLNLHELGKVYAAPFKSPPQAYVDNNGNFIFENLKPGKYYIVNASDGHNVYAITTSEETMKKNLVTVEAGQVVYIGSYVIDNVKNRVLASSTFEFKKVQSPDAKTVIKELIPQTKDTGWDKKLQTLLKRF